MTIAALETYLGPLKRIFNEDGVNEKWVILDVN